MRFTLIAFTLFAGALAQSTVDSTATSTTSASKSASETASKTASSTPKPSVTPFDNSIPESAMCAITCIAKMRDPFEAGVGCDPTVGGKCMCEDEEVIKELGRCIQKDECGNETLEYIRDITYDEKRCKPQGFKYNKAAFNAGVQDAGGDLGKTEEQKKADEEGAAGKSAVGLGVMAGAAVLALAVVL